MDDAELKQLIEAQAKTLQGIPATANLSGMAKDAVAQAVPYAWKSYEWAFKRKEATIDTVASQEHIVLPEDFGSLLHLNFKQDTNRGWNIQYLDEDLYDLKFPNPLMHAKTYPRFCKIVKDNATGRWRAYFTPVPDAAYTLDFGYSIEVGGADNFPSGFEDLLISAAWIFMYPKGSAASRAAKDDFKEARNDAIENVDQQHRQRTSQIRRQRRFDHEGHSSVPWDWWNVADGSDY
jgi:hypothetical protein